MSEKEADRFIETLQRNDQFAEQLMTLRDDPQALFAEVQRHGFAFEPEEIKAAFLESYSDGMSEELLEQIAGGVTDQKNIAIGLGTAGGIVVLAGASAAAAAI